MPMTTMNELELKNPESIINGSAVENQINNIVPLSGFQLFLVCHLLSNTFNRSFMKSLQFQVKQWINDPQYHYPLTGKQEKAFEKTNLFQMFKARNYNFKLLYDV